MYRCPARNFQAEEMFNLIGGDQDRRARSEPGHHRMRDEVDQRAHARQPHHQLNHPRQKRQRPRQLTYCAVPGSACGDSTENSTIEAAVVGPDTRCQEEPNSAVMMAGIMPAYSPYSGGMPAMVANATPCGSATSAPVSPAISSSRRLLPVAAIAPAQKRQKPWPVEAEGKRGPKGSEK